MDFEKLTKEQLWQLRNEVVVNSVFVADFRNSFGFDEKDISAFFDGYYDYLWEIAEENNDSDKELTHKDVMEYDNANNLECWFDCYDDLSWIKNNC